MILDKQYSANINGDDVMVSVKQITKKGFLCEIINSNNVKTTEIVDFNKFILGLKCPRCDNDSYYIIPLVENKQHVFFICKKCTLVI